MMTTVMMMMVVVVVMAVMMMVCVCVHLFEGRLKKRDHLFGKKQGLGHMGTTRRRKRRMMKLYFNLIK
jgi:type IV secretory pathway VirB3-like protein